MCFASNVLHALCRCTKQPLDFRDEATFSGLKVKKGASSIHGTGVFSKHRAVESDVLLDVVVPSENVGKDFEYDCYEHIMHRDGLGAMHINSSEKMRGNYGACREDFALKFLRLLNHSKNPNVQISTREAATPAWYEALGKDWYQCSFSATRTIKRGEELTFAYHIPPRGAV